jgi:HD-GYP domain-containing protein (c-di-GMP phosphodiesterase class II)
VESILGREQRPDEKLLAISLKIDAFKLCDVGHTQRVAGIAKALATAFNLASRDLFLLDQAALVQNIGELQMDRQYLSAARELTANERIDLQRHPVIGEQEAAKLDLPRGVQLIVRWHHEWWNGSGYPDRLEGEQIPLAARILRAADTYAALTSTRPYRRAKSTEEARQLVIEWAGIEFDPEVARVLLAVKIPDLESDPARTVVDQNSLSIAS